MPDAPYRNAPASSAPVPAELVYTAHERDINRAFHRVWIRTWLLGMVGVIFFTALGFPWGAWLVLAGVLLWSLADWRRTKRGIAIVFRVEDGALTLCTRGGREPFARLRLTELRDVVLDTKAITPAMRDTSIAAVAVEMKVRPSVDIARIVLVPNAPRETVPLTEEHVAHMDAVAGMGKIRSFLRKHGWVPEDEREAEA
jgi:hypothetical protein